MVEFLFEYALMAAESIPSMSWSAMHAVVLGRTSRSFCSNRLAMSGSISACGGQRHLCGHPHRHV